MAGENDNKACESKLIRRNSMAWRKPAESGKRREIEEASKTYRYTCRGNYEAGRNSAKSKSIGGEKIMKEALCNIGNESENNRNSAAKLSASAMKARSNQQRRHGGYSSWRSA